MHRARFALIALGALAVGAAAFAIATPPSDATKTGLLVDLQRTLAGVFTHPSDAPKSGLFVEPDPMDFGDVPWLDSPTKRIRLTNRTDHAVMVRNPHFTCSCFALLTQVPPSIHPGTSVELTVQMWSRMGTPGRFHKELTFETDDPTVGTLAVPVVGTIVDFRSVTPTQVVLGAIRPDDDPVRKVVEVRGGSGYAVHVASAKTSDARLSIEVKPVEGGADVIVTTAAKPSKGWISAQMKLELDVGPSPGVAAGGGAAAGGGTHRYVETVSVSGEVK
jgi:hypothetical protein